MFKGDHFKSCSSSCSTPRYFVLSAKSNSSYKVPYNNVSPNRTRPYSQSPRKTLMKRSQQVVEITAEGDGTLETSPVEGVTEGAHSALDEHDTGLQDLVKKFTHGNKTSRQVSINTVKLFITEH